MDYSFAPEHDAFRGEVREFIQRELPPRIAAGEDAYSDENFDDAMTFRRKLGAKRWIGIGWPTEYGGLGATPMMQAIFHEEMIYLNAPLDPQAYQVGPAIIDFGGEDLKKKFLSATANQEILWCQGFSEPNAGSDLAGLQTAATADGDDYVINGQKIWTSQAHRADYIHILTRTDPDAPKHKGISYFLLDMQTPGITISPLISIDDVHHFNQVFFDNVRVPKGNMIGDENQGWYVAMTTLNNERSGIRDVSRARRTYDRLVRALRETPALAPVRRDPIARHRLAELAIEAQTSRNLSYHVAWMQDNGIQPDREASMAKLFASELHQRITKAGLELLGLYGQAMPGDRYAPVHGAIPFESLSNVANTIAAGSSEVNRNIIATRGLGLPR